MAEATKTISREWYEKLIAELQELKQDKLPAVLEQIADAKELWDLSENFDYKNALEEKDLVNSRIKQIEDLIDGVEIKEKSNNSKFLNLVVGLKSTLETELNELCGRVLKTIDDYLLKRASSDESKVFYLKMKGDYYRYLAEFTTGDKNIEVANNSMNSYKEANSLANKLPCTNPIKLGLALNFSVFYYEVKNDAKEACTIASEAFDAAIHQLEKIEDEQYKDSTTILQLLKENIDMWKADLQEQEEGAGGDEE